MALRESCETVKKENSTYPERSEYIGAYEQSELIGFIRMVYVGKTAVILQIIAMQKHSTKCVTNALVAKAVEIAAEKRMTHLIYAKYICRNRALMDFKRHNGFELILYPRYFIPISTKGALALKLNLHKGLKEAMPPSVAKLGLKLKAKWVQWATGYPVK